ncbi:hypothetical protein [Pararhodonellum marinum]|uniref:hypothetical protein n=1 Tax=Pararhodonellum marinum TaxID=2755358 RepID=UPI00188FE686|nr:hypothetical protein [Pararhodonellum marinum]
MSKSCLFLSLIGLTWLLVSCGEKRIRKNETIVPLEVESKTNSKSINFFHYEELNEYPDAILEMFKPLGNERFEPGRVPFEFNIKNFPFGESLQRFPLKIVINGQDPIGYNMPIFSREFNTGTYRVTAFLVDPDGISLKNFGNYVDRDFIVGASRPFPGLEEPYLVLNLPNNETEYNQQDEILVDFLLIGGDFEQDGLKCLLTLGDWTHETRELNPIRIENLPKGDYDLKLSLLKENGEELTGLFSTAFKKIKVN